MTEFPDSVFFHPTPEFWDFMDQEEWLRWQRFCDIGAGVGKLTDGMIEHGFECTGIDLFSRPSQSLFVELGNATECNWGPDDCLLLARPCHGSFVEQVLRRSVPQAEVLYIGLERNFAEDLKGWVYETLLKNAGVDGEQVIRILGRENETEEWFLLDTEFWENPQWMKSDDDGWWRNFFGGGFPKTEGMKIIERRELGDFYQIHISLEQLCSQTEDLLNGWITPAGKWYAGEIAQHADILSHVLGITEARAEELGFIRCYGGQINPFWTIKDGINPTKEQRTQLRKLSFDLKDDFQDQREVL